jgi:hypothetical protein
MPIWVIHINAREIPPGQCLRIAVVPSVSGTA